jgi:hypothetical protein
MLSCLLTYCRNYRHPKPSSCYLISIIIKKLMSQKAPFYHRESVGYNFKVLLICNKNLFEGLFFLWHCKFDWDWAGPCIKKEIIRCQRNFKKYWIILISETWNNQYWLFWPLLFINLTWHDLKNSQRPVVLLLLWDVSQVILICFQLW